jgi:exodeoxyribonuclease-3
MITIFSWNVNSVNARLANIVDLINQYKPDVLLLQETKCEDHKFPQDIFKDLGYNIAMTGQKSYNGVAILSKYRINDVQTKGFKGFEIDARYIEALVEANGQCVRIASVYVPNGHLVLSEKFPRKLDYIDNLREYLESIDEHLVIGGDFNVAQEPLDLYDPIKFKNHLGFHDQERFRLNGILDGQFKDSLRHLYPHKKVFSWWDYRDKFSFKANRGWRIDYILSNRIENVNESGILTETREWIRPSDHAPVFCEIRL